MTDTTNLGLPCIEGGQAQKHVTHNEALRILDTLVQLAVNDRDLTVPPGSPVEGDRYIVDAGATGAWAGRDHEIAAWQDGGWQFSAPNPGWLAYVIDEGVLLAFDGAAWQAAVIVSGVALQNLSLVGVGTTADSVNPLSAKLNNALFSARAVANGGDGNIRCKLSKESAANTASLLLQADYSGRAELGLTGDDNFRIKVSADGSTWRDAIVIDRASGQVSFPQGGAGNDLELTLAQLTLSVADALNTAQFLGASGNRFADSFETLSHVDGGGAINLDTGEAGLLKPTAAVNNSLATQTLNENSPEWGGYGIRVRIAANVLTFSGGKVRITLAPPSSGSNLILAAVLIGHKAAAGNAWDFALSPARTQVTFNGGNAGVTLIAGGGGITSDVVNFALDETRDVIIALDVASGDLRRNTGMSSDFTFYSRAGGAGEAASNAPSGYVSVANRLDVVTRIEVLAGTNDCTVTSVALPAASIPASARLVARVKEIDAVLLNTDLIFSASRDGGVTWTAFTMNRKYTANSISVYESDQLDMSAQPSGTSMKWKAAGANARAFELHDLYLYWS